MLFKISKDEKRTSKINAKYIETDFKNMPEITEETKKQNSEFFFWGSVRVNNGMYFTSADGEKYIEESLKRRLP